MDGSNYKVIIIELFIYGNLVIWNLFSIKGY